ncbi:MAG: type II toxin-antitoxin system VapC family toxin [Ferroplasma sp.]
MILVDTDVLIEILDRQSEKGDDLMKRILGSGERYCTSSINLHELLYGILKYSKSKGLVRELPIIGYTEKDAKLSSYLEMAAEKMGNAIPRIDAMIASVAINNNYACFTLDKHFNALKEYGLELFD